MQMKWKYTYITSLFLSTFLFSVSWQTHAYSVAHFFVVKDELFNTHQCSPVTGSAQSLNLAEIYLIVRVLLHCRKGTYLFSWTSQLITLGFEANRVHLTEIWHILPRLPTYLNSWCIRHMVPLHKKIALREEEFKACHLLHISPLCCIKKVHRQHSENVLSRSSTDIGLNVTPNVLHASIWDPFRKVYGINHYGGILFWCFHIIPINLVVLKFTYLLWVLRTYQQAL